MLTKILTKVFGSRNDRTLRRLRKEVEKLTALSQTSKNYLMMS